MHFEISLTRQFSMAGEFSPDFSGCSFGDFVPLLCITAQLNLDSWLPWFPQLLLVFHLHGFGCKIVVIAVPDR